MQIVWERGAPISGAGKFGGLVVHEGYPAGYGLHPLFIVTSATFIKEPAGRLPTAVQWI